MTQHWTTHINNGACLASALFWVFSLIAAFLTLTLNPWDHRVALTPDFRFAVWSGFSGTDPVLVFFNQNEGPYRGSLITVEGDPRPPVVSSFDWEFPRIYYRHIRRDDSIEWTLMVSLWYPLIVFAIGPVAWGASRWKCSRAKTARNPDQRRDNA